MDSQGAQAEEHGTEGLASTMAAVCSLVSFNQTPSESWKLSKKTAQGFECLSLLDLHTEAAMHSGKPGAVLFILPGKGRPLSQG